MTEEGRKRISKELIELVLAQTLWLCVAMSNIVPSGGARLVLMVLLFVPITFKTVRVVSLLRSVE